MSDSSPMPQGNNMSSSSSVKGRDSNSDGSEGSLIHGTDYESQRLNYGLARRREPSHDRARRKSFIEEDEDSLQLEDPTRIIEQPVTWMSLPHKSQLVILTMARLSEPLVQTSLRVSQPPSSPHGPDTRHVTGLMNFQSYLFYQLKSFDQSLPDSVIASQAGIMQGAFAAAQLCTAMLWGRFSDAGGRKRVLLMGLSGTMLSCVGFGFSRTFWQALIFRMMGGALNGNVGVMRTMISEIVREKK
jgi:hypothetical protein